MDVQIVIVCIQFTAQVRSDYRHQRLFSCALVFSDNYSADGHRAGLHRLRLDSAAHLVDALRLSKIDRYSVNAVGLVYQIAIRIFKDERAAVLVDISKGFTQIFKAHSDHLACSK